jgi:spore coat protein U-like protein
MSTSNLKIALAACLLGATASAFAGSSTNNLAVTATVLDACLIITTPVAFGNYSSSAATVTKATGTVALTCTLGTTGTVTLGQGSNAASGSTDTVPLRQMAAGSGRLGYFLYQDTGRTTVWGNTAPTGITQAGTGLLGTAINVYGSIPINQNVPVGIYLDTVVATVSF